jgi:hypothetical protein
MKDAPQAFSVGRLFLTGNDHLNSIFQVVVMDGCSELREGFVL